VSVDSTRRGSSRVRKDEIAMLAHHFSVSGLRPQAAARCSCRSSLPLSI